MSNKILSITKKEPRETKLPDGNYVGTWGGYIISLRYNDQDYELKTEEGVRGIGFKVVVTIKGSEMTFIEVKN